MTITLNLEPEVEKGLLTRATALGVSLDDYLNDIVVREANISPEPERRTGKDVVDACAKVRGLFTDGHQQGGSLRKTLTRCT